MATKEIVVIPNQILMQKSDKVKEYKSKINTLITNNNDDQTNIIKNQQNVAKQLAYIKDYTEKINKVTNTNNPLLVTKMETL
jgi:ribosome-interacting GTPase 1